MHNYVSSRKTIVKLINETPRRKSFLFWHYDFSGIRLQNTQQAKSLLSSSFISPLAFFLYQRGTHNQHTNSLSGTLPSSLALRLRVISDRKEEKRDGERVREGVAVSSTEHKVPFVFRFRDLPRTSIAVGAAVRAFLHPRPTG